MMASGGSRRVATLSPGLCYCATVCQCAILNQPTPAPSFIIVIIIINCHHYLLADLVLFHSGRFATSFNWWYNGGGISLRVINSI